MAEALSQNQIDELLQKVRAGIVDQNQTEPKAKEKLYDFTSPKKFTKDQLTSLNNLYENYSRVLSSYFTSVLRSVCEVSVSQIEEQRYHEFSNALPDNTLVGMILFKPDTGACNETTIMMEFPTAFGFLVVDRLMGGTSEVYAPDRGYTDIETSLLSHILTNVTRYMQEAWSGNFPLTTSLRSIETNGRLLQAFSPQDIVVIVSMEIREEHFSGTANICMPAENLEDLIKSFSVKYSHEAKQSDPEKERMKQEVVMEYLKQSDLEVKAFLDICPMSLGEICQLQVNDVISLNRSIDEDVEVYVEGIPWYTARLGEAGSKKAIKLVAAIEDNTK
ncbi:flagellar motor switch protein FliM [Acidaminobacterium chupaoyuni]